MRSADQDQNLRYQAVQIVAQLPESEADALAVLNYSIELVTGFMRGGEQGPAKVLPFPRLVKP